MPTLNHDLNSNKKKEIKKNILNLKKLPKKMLNKDELNK